MAKERTKPFTHSVRVKIQFPNEGYKVSELVTPTGSKKEMYEAINDELYQMGCAISDSAADCLNGVASINEIVIFQLVKQGFAEATELAKNNYYLVSNFYKIKEKISTNNITHS